MSSPWVLRCRVGESSETMMLIAAQVLAVGVRASLGVGWVANSGIK